MAKRLDQSSHTVYMTSFVRNTVGHVVMVIISALLIVLFGGGGSANQFSIVPMRLSERGFTIAPMNGRLAAIDLTDMRVRL
ncbi:hypothetical protein GCM10025751_53720 [Haladaptatus pallidirubidus]|uniref:Uncharacterized protein n=1 Tax=Haladaptatus pallidirubidus TaxID=1008152 RepID=A0AAV3UQT0_9EURY